MATAKRTRRTSPTQRSLELLRDEGYTAEITEHWNPFARIRKDLFGFVDILAVKDDVTLGVQTTTGSNVKARINKIMLSDNTPKLRGANWKLEVHGWRKLKDGKWSVRRVDVS